MFLSSIHFFLQIVFVVLFVNRNWKVVDILDYRALPTQSKTGGLTSCPQPFRGLGILNLYIFRFCDGQDSPGHFFLQTVFVIPFVNRNLKVVGHFLACYNFLRVLDKKDFFCSFKSDLLLFLRRKAYI